MKRSAFLFLAVASSAWACDLCGTTLIRHSWDPRKGFTFGASEQYTRFGSLQDNGHEIGNDEDQKMDSSITQIFLGYRFNSRFGVQLNVPLIYKAFRRATDAGTIEDGRVRGLGDVSMTANYMVLDYHTGDFAAHAGVSAGIKFPTGDSDRVKEEGAEGHSHGDAGAEEHSDPAGEEAEAGHGEGEKHAHDEVAPHDHADIPSGIHGHDLALGTGSLDGIFGADVDVHWKRLFFAAEVQFALRGDGDHDYDFADDLLWSGGPGVRLIEKDTHTLSVQCICSGETKGEDEFRGVRADDTATTQVFLGPKISATWKERFAAEVELDVPVYQDNSGVQSVPDYRVRAAVSWAF